MKKLVMFAVAVALACAGQAASVDWKLNVAGQGADWKAANAYVMAFNGSDYAAVVKLLTVDGSDNMAADLGAYALKQGDTSQFAVGNSRGAANASGQSSGVTGDTMFWVVFTEGSMDAGKSIAYTGATDISAYDYAAGSPSPGTFTFTSVPNTGTIAGVPEPTSGLLMLVGLAGLALRRKRA